MTVMPVNTSGNPREPSAPPVPTNSSPVTARPITLPAASAIVRAELAKPSSPSPENRSVSIEVRG